MSIPKFFQTNFRLDAIQGATYPGYTDGKTWNGWACPCFEYEVARQILRDSEKNGYQWSYDPTRDAFLIAHQDDPADFEPEIFEAIGIRTGGSILKVYPIGAYSWTWETVE